MLNLLKPISYLTPAWPTKKIPGHIQELSGKHFDPTVVTAFIRMVG